MTKYNNGNRTIEWSSVTQKFHYGKSSHDSDRKIFGVMTPGSVTQQQTSINDIVRGITDSGKVD
jgi:hypothetical protein